ncbi:MAG: hypothetical protein AMXMBFR78_02890 [Rubrivivax sp.]|jgi:acyl carrier protein
MNLEPAAIEANIKARVVEIAASLGADASDLTSDEVIPATGYIDSAGLLELIAWYEDAYRIKIPAEDFTIDHLGTVAAMVRYVIRRKAMN